MVAADQDKSRLVLVSGPSRGGKSRWAEHLLSEDLNVTYVATSPDRPDDQDWQARLELHRQRRPSHWRVVEADPDLTSALLTIPQHSSVLIDALGGFTKFVTVREGGFTEFVSSKREAERGRIHLPL